jgi:UPF0042 nucleotide-binding protein
MQFTVVTGLSGSGKTQVVRFLEDKGYFCIDNMPPMLLPKFAEMFFTASGKFEHVAFVIDIRVGDMFTQLLDQLKLLKDNGYEYTLLFLDADDKTLVKRYKETRRTHPIASNKGLLDSIAQERKMLGRLYAEADYVINTSDLSVGDLFGKLQKIFNNDTVTENTIAINVMAFGFKYGVPLDADLMFDVRCFPNPFYIDELKELTGNDKPVQDYVMSFSDASAFMDKLYDMMKFLIPLYAEEGKPTLTIAIGCTGGRHRSVTMANMLGDMLKNDGCDVSVNYRDIEKGKNQ